MTAAAPARTAPLAPVYGLAIRMAVVSAPGGLWSDGTSDERLVARHDCYVHGADGLLWPAGGEPSARVALPVCGHVDPDSTTAAIWRAEWTCAVCECAERGIVLPRAKFEHDPADGDHAMIAKCHGANHRHFLNLGRCSACHVPVARNDKGNLVTVIHRGDLGARTAVCWDAHRCNAYLVAEVARWAVNAFAQATAEGRMVKGSTVRVYKGRKVPKGTVGVVRWIGQAYSGGERFGLSVDDLDGLTYVDAAHCQPV